MPLLSIIIVNYKTPDLTYQCINSIYKADIPEEVEIILVDNCSEDGSELQITKKFQDVIWINNPVNAGFGRGNNLGVSHANGKYILFLNSDILLEEDTVKVCLNYMENNPKIGVLGCKLLNEDGSLQKSVYHYVGDYMGVLRNNLLVDFIFKPKALKIKAVMGSFMLIPKNIFNEVGGFDPDFFMYAEELDLCRRIEQKGHKIHYLETVSATHKHGGSSEGSDWSHKQNYLSNALLYLKVRGVMGYFIYHILSAGTFITNLLLLWKMDKNYRKDFWQDQKKYFSNYWNYIKIPFLYSKSMGDGKKILKRA